MATYYLILLSFVLVGHGNGNRDWIRNYPIAPASSACECNGHAYRCLPFPGEENLLTFYQTGYGRCDCEHNTAGINCEQCEDFFNDLPWLPANGNRINACKRCNCNNHAMQCYFDPVVYEASGNRSGGVCINCMHNTQGHKCENCKPFYFLRPDRSMYDFDACQPCDCDVDGSKDDGVCISSGPEAGKCRCKDYVEGQRCDKCKEGYWNIRSDNPNGCKDCKCQSCDTYTGKCSFNELNTDNQLSDDSSSKDELEILKFLSYIFNY